MTHAPVTRVEIADHIEDVFRPNGATRDQIIERAIETDARPEVLAELKHLSERTFSAMRDIWKDLESVPVGIAS